MGNQTDDLTLKEKETLDAMDAVEPYGTAEIAELLGLERRSALYRLGKLEEKGAVRKKMLNNSTAVWVKPPNVSASDEGDRGGVDA